MQKVFFGGFDEPDEQKPVMERHEPATQREMQKKFFAENPKLER